jgi:hypothetical protein
MSRDQAVRRAIHLSAVRGVLHVAVEHDQAPFKPDFLVLPESDHYRRCRTWVEYARKHRVVWPKEN